jgi:toxin CcdB
MAQFDVRRNVGARRGEVPFVVVVQSGRFDAYGRRVVIPLVARSAVTTTDPNLNPTFNVEGQDVVLHPLDIVSVAKDSLGECVGSLEHESDRIIAAIDVVISRAWG